MSDLTAKFTALEEQLAAQASTMEGYVDTVEAKLQLINDNLAVLQENGAVNTRALLNAITASGGCIPCELPSLVVPPIVSGDNPVDVNKCKRTQAFLHAMEQVYTTADIISGFGIGWNPTLYTDAMSQVIAGFDTGDTPDTPSWPEANQIVNYAIEYGIGNFLVGETLSNYFSSIRNDAKNAIYSALDIDGDRSAYIGVLATSSIPGYAQNLLSALAYQNLWNYYFDPASTPNLSSFDGTDCLSIGSCQDWDGETPWVTNFAGTFLVRQPPFPYSPNPLTFSIGDFFGWTLTLTSYTGTGDIKISYYDTDDVFHAGHDFVTLDESWTLDFHTNAIGVYMVVEGGIAEFHFAACPPGVEP